jgi:hypothetical protein
MNPSTTPTPTPSTPTPGAIPAIASFLRQFAAILIPVGLATALADFLFWGGQFGLSVSVFFAGLVLLILARHRGRLRVRTVLFALLLAATCVQSALALSLSNILAAVALALALAGEVFQPQLAGMWARTSEAIYGVLSAPKRWLDVHVLVERGVASVRSGVPNLGSNVAFLIWVLVPAGGLLLIFALLFTSGNAVFGDLIQRANHAFLTFWENLNVTPLRVVWWGVVATLALGVFHGTRAPSNPRWWTRLMPRVPRADAQLATWQAALALLAVNALFCVVNTLDAVFLWGDSALPADVNRSEFVHAGVNNLIVAVVLSAVIIAGIFQQEDRAANRPWLKRLAHLWVLQNFLLLGGVLRRLQFYTQDYHLTEKRVYVGCFLVLVAVGFLLLAWFVQKRRSFNWLLGRNAVAVLVLFFVLQFADVAGAVARYNVARWERKEGAALDLEYLASLGPTAWPELIHVARATRNRETAATANQLLHNLFDEPRATDWRAYQWQRAVGFRQLDAYVAANP